MFFYAGLSAQGVLDVQVTWSGTQQPSHRSDSLSWKQQPTAADDDYDPDHSIP